MYGADDFLPVLTYVVAQCDMLELDTEIEYMMELLDPSLLHGEGKWFLILIKKRWTVGKEISPSSRVAIISSE